MYRPLKVPLSISLFCYPFFITSSWKISFLVRGQWPSYSYSSIIICQTILVQTISPNYGTHLSKCRVRKFWVMLIEWLPVPQECSLSPPLRQINTVCCSCTMYIALCVWLSPPLRHIDTHPGVMYILEGWGHWAIIEMIMVAFCQWRLQKDQFC